MKSNKSDIMSRILFISDIIDCNMHIHFQKQSIYERSLFLKDYISSSHLMPFGCFICYSFSLFWKHLITKIFHFFTSKYSFIPIMLCLNVFLFFKFLFQLFLLKKSSTFFSELILIKLELFTYKLARNKIIFYIYFSALILNHLIFLQYSFNGFLTISFIQPFIFTDLVVVYLLIKYILILAHGSSSLNKLIFMLDSFRSLDCCILLLIFRQ